MERIIDEQVLGELLRQKPVILDARTPDEFAEDHIADAINVPVLSNEQREEVGTLFKDNAFEARKLGARYATAAISAFLGSELGRELRKAQHILVYCARGGQRSGSLAVVLSQIGFMVHRLKKGYKTYRQYVLEAFDKLVPQPVYVLYGYTGSGKTRILLALHEQVNVLDLEGLAHHRGSLLGNLPNDPQPTQRAFESALMETLQGFDPNLPTLVEGESRKVGRVSVPQQIWQQMKQARHLWLDIPRQQRVAFILEDYQELKSLTHLVEPMEKLQRYLPTETFEEMQANIAAGHWQPVVESLLVNHYDPLYARPLKAGNRIPLKASNCQDGIRVVGKAIQDRLTFTPLPEGETQAE